MGKLDGIDVIEATSLDNFENLNPRFTYIMVPPEKYKALSKERLLFRGDSRTPEEIFRHGFAPRATWCSRPVWRATLSDIHPHSSVCLVGDFETACTFPLINVGQTHRKVFDRTWVYAVLLPAGQLYFNTQRMQARVASGLVHSGGGVNEQTKFVLQAGEVCTQVVEADRVLAAVAVERSWRSDNWTELGEYRVHRNTSTVNYRAFDRSVAQKAKQQLLPDLTLRPRPMRISGGEALGNQLRARYEERLRESIRRTRNLVGGVHVDDDDTLLGGLPDFGVDDDESTSM